jgi:uncharacterized protein
MSDPSLLPRATAVFVAFASLMRRNRFAVAPEQTTSFLTAIEMLGPRSIEDIRQAALATLAPSPDRRADFDALFRFHFYGDALPVLLEGENDDEVKVEDSGQDENDYDIADANESGLETARAESLGERHFNRLLDLDPLRRFARRASTSLPERRGHRRMRVRRGGIADLRRTLQDAVKNDGEVIRLRRLRRRLTLRKVLVLIDVSGSMKIRTEENLELAHAIVQAVPHAEIFTFGTRLTRVTKPLKLKRREQALIEVGHLVSDWDGGTRIGDALQAFLAVPRFAGYARGAVVAIISDGLERGTVDALRNSVIALSRRAWSLSWLTPLATGRDFVPKTEGLVAIRPFVDWMEAGGSVDSIVEHLLSLRRRLAA